MAVELGEIAAGLPFAASIAMTTGISALREGRRRTTLNEAIHELRRPLQALALSLPAEPEAARASGSALRMVAGALERLEREINGEAVAPVAELVEIGPLMEAALGRWRPRAAQTGRSLSLRLNGGRPVVWADAEELAQAVDNLISNGFEHGRGTVEIVVAEERDRLRIAVRDSGPRRRRAESARIWSGIGPSATDPRHGHGLRVVRRVAARHGGSFRLRLRRHGSEARLELPMAGGER